MKTSFLKLDGLKCSGCSEIIERATQQLAGVNACRVNLDLRQAEIEYDPQLIRLETIQKALAAVGYPSTLVDETTQIL